MQTQRGFTLIELIVVIVILGVLSVVAVPKFLSFGEDARIASVERMVAVLQSTSNLTHMQCQVSDTCDVSNWGDRQTINGADFCLLEGWFDAGLGGPLGSMPIGSCGIDTLLEFDGFTAQIGTGSDQGFEHWFQLDSAPDPDNCKAIYRQPDARGDLPEYKKVISGC